MICTRMEDRANAGYDVGFQYSAGASLQKDPAPAFVSGTPVCESWDPVPVRPGTACSFVPCAIARLTSWYRACEYLSEVLGG